MDYSQIDFSPLWISLKTGIVASMVSFVLGILAAWFVVSRRGRTRGIWDGILTMPLVLPPTVAGYILLRILSGITLTFTRALGEYGATSMLAGNIAGKTSTISQQIAMVIQSGDFKTAGFWCIVITAISFICLVIINFITGDR